MVLVKDTSESSKWEAGHLQYILRITVGLSITGHLFKTNCPQLNNYICCIISQTKQSHQKGLPTLQDTLYLPLIFRSTLPIICNLLFHLAVFMVTISVTNLKTCTYHSQGTNQNFIHCCKFLEFPVNQFDQLASCCSYL